MSKITKTTLISVLAFFILGSTAAHAQDIKTFDNGLRVIVKEDHRNPLVVFSVLIEVGSAYEGKYTGSGISHLIEHMVFKGTKKYGPGDIENILHTYGGKINAFTSYDYTGFKILILKEHKDIALDILKEILTSPAFNAKELEKEMQVIEREMDLNKDDPSRRLSRITFSSAFSRHPYKFPIIGYKDNFRRLKRDDLLEFFSSKYTPEKIVIAIVGDMDSKDVFESVKRLFSDLPRGDNVIPVLPAEPEQIAQRIIEERLDIDGAYLNIAFRSTGLLDKDLYAFDLLSFILGDGEDSILNRELRIKKELVLSISAYNYTPKYPGLFVISSVLKEGNVKGALEGVIQELENVKEKGVTSGDLEKAKNNFAAWYIYQKETMESQATDMATAELLTGDLDFFDQYIEKIKGVSLKEIQDVARKYLDRDAMTVAVVSKSGNLLRSSRETAAQELNREIKKITLPNRLVILISKDPSIPIVSISLLFKGGVRAETKENNGIAKLTSLMLMDSTDTMTREDIARFYESKGMSVSSYSGNNSMGITAKCLSEHTEDALGLVSRLCMKSIFPENELERERRELVSAIEMQDNSIFNHGHRLLKETIFKTHPYRFQDIGTVESVKRLTRQDVMSFYETIISADNAVLGIAGDLDIEETERLVEKYFSDLPLKKPGLPVPGKEPPINKLTDLSIKKDKEQSLVLIGFQGIDIYDSDRYSLEVMVNMLSSESGIIFKSIREESGLSYAAGAFHVPGIDPGYIAIYALTSRENIENVRGIIFKELKAFIKKGSSPEELETAKNHLKAMRQMELETSSGFMFMSGLDELYGLGYEDYKDYGKNIDTVTREDIKRAAARFLTLDRCAVVMLEGK